MATFYDVGDTPKLTFTVTVDGVLTDAASVTLTLTKPDGTTATPRSTDPDRAARLWRTSSQAAGLGEA